MTAVATAARILAIAIAILGVWDPAMTSMREGAPDIAIVAPVVTLSEAKGLLFESLRDRLGDDYHIVDGPWQNAAATIVIGNSLPDRIPSGKIFAIRDTTVAIERFDVPTEVTSEARIPIAVTAPNATVKLHAQGAVVDSTVILSEAKDLLFSPWSAGVFTLEARAARGRDTVSAFAITHVVDRAHSVLFFDRRPSWMSTFVRRSLEADRRFAVASRVVTSRNVSTAAGQPPSTLADPSLLELYDVIVVGAPTTLTAADVNGLEQFLRRRGGAVVLLYDAGTGRGSHDRLTGVTSWTARAQRAPIVAMAEDDTTALRFTEAAFAAHSTGIHRALATASNGDSSHSVVWATNIGAGQVIVSGALDAWKYRDRATSGFDEFWRSTISRAAREASQPIRIEATPNLAKPGERIALRVTVRDTLSRPDVRLDSTTVPVYRGARRGEFVATIRAPEQGEHWLDVAASGARAQAPIVVRANATRSANNEWASVALIARASGGVAGSLDSVVAAVKERVVREQHPTRWWPMRNGWWVVPFAALLGIEWIVRRRRGLA
jgi:hypothetical protein